MLVGSSLASWVTYQWPPLKSLSSCLPVLKPQPQMTHREPLLIPFLHDICFIILWISEGLVWAIIDNMSSYSYMPQNTSENMGYNNNNKKKIGESYRLRKTALKDWPLEMTWLLHIEKSQVRQWTFPIIAKANKQTNKLKLKRKIAPEICFSWEVPIFTFTSLSKVCIWMHNFLWACSLYFGDCLFFDKCSRLYALSFFLFLYFAKLYKQDFRAHQIPKTTL